MERCLEKLTAATTSLVFTLHDAGLLICDLYCMQALTSDRCGRSRSRLILPQCTISQGCSHSGKAGAIYPPHNRCEQNNVFAVVRFYFATLYLPKTLTVANFVLKPVSLTYCVCPSLYAEEWSIVHKCANMHVYMYVYTLRLRLALQSSPIPAGIAGSL